ncbi:MAG: hypothetical protein IJC71_02620 [Clostridia bacterium]|nr:hypothetical protein [Clostridia bacterium]
MIQKMLEERQLPQLLKMKDGTPVTKENWNARRLEILDILQTQEYGRMPEPLGETSAKVLAKNYHTCGQSTISTTEITIPTPDGKSYSFKTDITVPKSASAENPVPAFVYISFGGQRSSCIEEITEQNVILAEMVMNDVSTDRKNTWTEQLDAHWFEDGKRAPDDWGKIGMWAFAASRVLDYLYTFDCLDKSRVGVIGHSRLGKTALWAGANDERFTHVFSNNSGCSGAAITRRKVGETFPRIADVFDYWFCENMQNISKDIETSESTDFDQHFLLAACAPRKVYVASAEEDTWADPVSEYLCCAAASPAWELLGETGFVHPDRLPAAWDRFADGNVGYHLRPGAHFLSRHDWKRYIDFIKR